MSIRTAVIEVSLQRLSLLRIEHPQANPLTLACTLRAGESLPSGLTVKAEVHASRNVAAETIPLASSTVSVAADATAFEVSFSSAQLNQAVAPNSVRTLWLVVYGVGPSDALYTLAAAEVALGWHAISQITPPPPSVPLLADVGGSPWATAVAYKTNHLVGSGGAIYLAVADHTSSAATQPGTGASWQTVWALFQGGTGPGGGNTILSGAGAPSNAVGSNGDFWINTTAWLIYGPKAAGAWPAGVSMIGPTGPQGAQGLTGAAGAAATVTVGTVNTGAAGTGATVTNGGTSSAAVFNFTIPRGDTGAQGPQGIQGIQGPQGLTGAAGAAATVTVGTVTTGAAGTSVVVTNTGTSSAAVFNFTIPRGDTGAAGPTGATGATGAAGATGADGAAATITVGTVTTLAAGLSATVTNVGTSTAAVFNFGIPRGADGTGTGGGGGDIAVWLARDNEPPSTAWATRDTRGALEVLDFSEINPQAACFSKVLETGVSLSNGFFVDVRWACSTATNTAQTVGWLVDLARISDNVVDLDNLETAWGAAKTIPLQAIPASAGVSLTTTVQFLAADLPSGLAAGDILRVRVRRNIDVDDASGDVELISVRVRPGATS